MSFTSKAKEETMLCIERLLELFGVVETEQMRVLFSFLKEAEYGRVITSMYRKGMVYFSSDSKYMANNPRALKRGDVSDSVNCFWAFICLKDKVNDFCGGTAPALISLSSKAKEYDLIPLSEETIEEINEVVDDLDIRTVRVFVTTNLKLVRNVYRREKNDVVIDVTDKTEAKIYEL